MYPEDLRYTKDHEWVRKDGSEYVVGITEYAAEQLGDVTYVDMPEMGLELDQGDVVCTIESVKAAEDAYAPVSGRVVEVNVRLESNPELVNESPHDDGWLFALEDVRQAQFKALLDAKAYEAYLAELGE